MIGLWITWLLMRLFIRTKSSLQVGDQSQNFALHTFFPEAAKGYVDYTSTLSFSIANSCGLITALQTLGNPSEPRSEKASKKEDSPKLKAKKAADH